MIVATGIIAVAISIGALVLSVKAWRKSRAIYAIETRVIRQPTGEAQDHYLEENAARLNRELSSGKYTVIALMQRKADNDWELFLGKIKQTGNRSGLAAIRQLRARQRRSP